MSASRTQRTSTPIHAAASLQSQRFLPGGSAIAALCGALVATLAAPAAHAASFTISNGQTVGGQTLSAPGDVGVIDVGGTISTTGGADGVHAGSSVTDAVVVNLGTIIASGSGGNGIDTLGTGAVVTNNGTITTLGSGGNGINSLGSDAVITNGGAITAQDEGIAAYGGNTVVVNSGTITSLGGFGIAAYDHAGDQVTNSGTINSLGNGAYGIFSSGADAAITVTDTGEIILTGNGGDGIYSGGSNAAINTTGLIETEGDASFGILSTGDRAIITQGGTIRSTGIASNAVLVTGTDAQVVNSGTILASGDHSDAIHMAGTDGVLDLLSGTVLEGRLVFDNPGSTTLKIGSGLQTALTLSGVPATIDTSGQPYVLDGSVLAVADPVGFEALDAATFALTRSIAGAVGQRMTATDAAPADRNGLWGAFYGAGDGRPNSDSSEGYLAGVGALAIGYDQALSGTDILGGFIGASAGSVETRPSSTSADLSGLFTGAYWGHDDGTVFSDLSISAGGMNTGNDRTIANNLVSGGLETAHAEFGSVFVSPAATIGVHTDVNGATVSPSLRLRYAGLYQQGYSESGSAADMTVEDRTAQSVEARGQIQVDLAHEVGEQGTHALDVRAGIDGIFSDNGTVAATLLGNDLGFAASDRQWTARGFLGADLAFSAAGGMVFKASAEAGYDTAGTVSLAAQASLHDSF